MAKEHIFKLSEPLKTHDGEVTELKLKTPRARLIAKHSDPFTLRAMKDRDGLEFTYDNGLMMTFIEDMTGVDAILLGDLATHDYYTLRQTVANLLLGVVPDKAPFVQSAD